MGAIEEEDSYLNFEVMYLAARKWGIQPSEFWQMTLSEWHAEYEYNVGPVDSEKYAGNLTEDKVLELELRAGKSDEEWWSDHGRQKH